MSCPKCDSDEIQGESVEIVGDMAYQACSCDKCECSWTDEYKLQSSTVDESCSHGMATRFIRHIG